MHLIFYYYLVDIIYKEYFLLSMTPTYSIFCFCLLIYILYILNITHLVIIYANFQSRLFHISHIARIFMLITKDTTPVPKRHKKTGIYIRKLFLLENINQNLCNHIFLDVGHKYMHTSCLIGTATQMSHVWEVGGGTTLYIHSFLTMKNDVDIDVMLVLLLLLFVVC